MLCSLTLATGGQLKATEGVAESQGYPVAVKSHQKILDDKQDV
jgi:hypothetical protein